MPTIKEKERCYLIKIKTLFIIFTSSMLSITMKISNWHKYNQITNCDKAMLQIQSQNKCITYINARRRIN